MMKVIKMRLKLPTGNGVWIFKFSVGNYEALSSASQREVCNRSSTDYYCHVPVEPLLDSSQIFQGWKNAQPVALLKISACSQAMNLDIRIPTVLMTIETIRERMIS